MMDIQGVTYLTSSLRECPRKNEDTEQEHIPPQQQYVIESSTSINNNKMEPWWSQSLKSFMTGIGLKSMNRPLQSSFYMDTTTTTNIHRPQDSDIN